MLGYMYNQHHVYTASNAKHNQNFVPWVPISALESGYKAAHNSIAAAEPCQPLVTWYRRMSMFGDLIAMRGKPAVPLMVGSKAGGIDKSGNQNLLLRSLMRCEWGGYLDRSLGKGLRLWRILRRFARPREPDILDAFGDLW